MEIHKGSVAKSYMSNDRFTRANICAFPHILGSPSSYMTLQPILSKFPYIWGKFSFLFLLVQVRQYNMPFATSITVYVQQIIHPPPAIPSYGWTEQDASQSQSSSLIFSLVKRNAPPSKYILPSTTFEKGVEDFSPYLTPFLSSDLHLPAGWLLSIFPGFDAFEGVNIWYLFWLGKCSWIYILYTAKNWFASNQPIKALRFSPVQF